MKNLAHVVTAVALLALLAPTAANADLAAYSQDFELLDQASPTALSDDGWLVYGNVYAPDLTYLYGYGAFPAPNHEFGFCQIDLLQGGVEQGLQQLVVFSDYNNVDHAVGNWIESNVFHEQAIGAADVGSIWSFSFQAKRGNIAGASTALAFIKTLNPAAGWATTNFLFEDMTAIPDTWGGWTISITIDASLVGQRLQFGFANTATYYESSGIFYDNVVFGKTGDVSSVPGAEPAGLALRQNYPNPFNPTTRIDFALERAGRVDLSVYDVAGRRIAVLERGELGAGEHHVTWDGRRDDGAPVPSGQYFYVLRTPTEQVARSMVLLK